MHMNGNGGGMLKCYFWNNRRPRKVDSTILLREFAHKPPELRFAVDRWIASLPDVSPAMKLNLMYFEQRSKWMSIGETASQLFYESFSPFNNRELLMAFSGLADQDAYEGHFSELLVRRMWPDLLDVPYCGNTRSLSKTIPKRLRVQLKRAKFLLGSFHTRSMT